MCVPLHLLFVHVHPWFAVSSHVRAPLTPEVCLCLCVVIVFPISCVLICDCPPCPFSPLSPVLSELQQADLITSEECRRLLTISGVVKVQSGKSPEVVTKTADALRRHGFEKEGDIVLLARGNVAIALNAKKLLMKCGLDVHGVNVCAF